MCLLPCPVIQGTLWREYDSFDVYCDVTPDYDVQLMTIVCGTEHMFTVSSTEQEPLCVTHWLYKGHTQSLCLSKAPQSEEQRGQAMALGSAKLVLVRALHRHCQNLRFITSSKSIWFDTNSPILQITHLSQGALICVQYATPSIVRPSQRTRRIPQRNPTMNRGEKGEPSRQQQMRDTSNIEKMSKHIKHAQA